MKKQRDHKNPLKLYRIQPDQVANRPTHEGIERVSIRFSKVNRILGCPGLSTRVPKYIKNEID